MTSRGRIRIITFDETAVGNTLVVPFGHIWRVWMMFIRYQASSDVATRTVLLDFKMAAGPADLNLTTTSIVADETENYMWGPASASNSPLSAHTDAGLGFYLVGPSDHIKLNVTNEQAADDWDVWGSIEDFVVPRA